MSRLDWEPFHGFVETLRRASDPRDLLENLLQGLVGMLRVSRGIILIREAGAEDLTPVAKHYDDRDDEFVQVSRTVAGRTLDARDVVFLDGDISEEWFAQASQASQALLPRAILCVPLLKDETAFGVLYLDGFTGRSDVTREQIPFVKVVAALASELLAAAETRSRLLAATRRLSVFGDVSLGKPMVFGPSAESRQLDEILTTAGPQNVSILVTGDTGTGKEMVARELHRRSKRRAGMFVPVNCAALPTDLIESELFGVEKGAYTGALTARPGRLEMASGGTLFLDEIGELDSAVQVKLLRVLEDRETTRIGGTTPVKLDFRLVCATNRDLEDQVREGLFRSDLYYRINVFRIHLTPLKMRRDDIEPMARLLLDDLSREMGRPGITFAAETMKRLVAHDWPGNVRELRNVIERALVVERGSSIGPDSLPAFGRQTLAESGPRSDGASLYDRLFAALEDESHPFEEVHDVFERAYLSLNLKRFKGNVSQMIRETGIPRNTMYRRLAKYGLQEDD